MVGCMCVVLRAAVRFSLCTNACKRTDGEGEAECQRSVLVGIRMED